MLIMWPFLTKLFIQKFLIRIYTVFNPMAVCFQNDLLTQLCLAHSMPSLSKNLSIQITIEIDYFYILFEKLIILNNIIVQ